MKNKILPTWPALFLVSAWLAFNANAEVKPNSLFADNCILQRDVPVPVWGTATSGEKVTVSFAGQSVTAIAANGTWKVWLQPMPASATPQTLTIQGDTTLNLSNVLVGDVWVASGQSNMERQLGPRPPQPEIIGWREAAATADYPGIHEYYVPEHMASAPLTDAGGKWTVCSPQTAPEFSAVGFYFARAIHQAENVPVGILFSAWGGTAAESWTSAESLGGMPEFRANLAALRTPDQRPYAEQMLPWYHDHDPGAGKDGDWSVAALDTAGWKPGTLPVVFGGDFDGLIWFRKVIELPESWAGQSAVLHLGTIDDADTTWVNGVQVGATYDWLIQRHYTLPAGLLKAGRNVIVIRALNKSGGGGFGGPPEQMKVVADNSALAPIPLSGEWLARVGVPMSQIADLPIQIGYDKNLPAVLYNAMIAPLQSFPIKGVIWYQGESNCGRGRQYRELFPLLIADWRKRWGLGDFPFLYVQIAPCKYWTPDIREAQLLTLQKARNSAMIGTADIGDANDMHPAQKAPVGVRLARAARALAYGEKIEYSGPLFDQMKIKEGRAVISFTHTGGGLMVRGGALRDFAIAGANGKFVPATAEIKDETVVVWSDEVKLPVAVRYGWAKVPEINLFNKEGLPASPFRTDDEKP